MMWSTNLHLVPLKVSLRAMFAYLLGSGKSERYKDGSHGTPYSKRQLQSGALVHTNETKMSV